MKQLYAAEGIASAVEFKLHAAIRTESDDKYHCPDEDPGCPLTKYVLCALNATATTQDEQVTFITCWDDSEGTPESRAKSCASKAKLDWDKISACESGSQGDALEKSANDYFAQRFPSHAHSGIFSVPHIEVDGVVQESTSYGDLLKVLCAKGIEAGACKHLPASVIENTANATGGTLKLTWKDCGDSSTHGHVSGLTPDSLTLGQKVTLTGTGKVDEAVDSGHFAIDVSAGPTKRHWTGDICEAKTFTVDVPLLGTLVTVTWDGMKCPIAAGDTTVATDIQMAASIPSSFAGATIKMSATTYAGDKLLCMYIDTVPPMEKELMV